MSSKSTINIKSIDIKTIGPDVSKFTKDELALFDADGFNRTVMTIKFESMSDAIYDGMFSIHRSQYTLPIKYLKPVDGSYSYVSQKSYINTNEHDMKNASITIEPLNGDFMEMIQYTPINQSIPLGTPVIIDVSVPFDTLPDGSEPDRKFIWSSNLKTIANIEDKIKEANPKSIRTKPWQECVHYGAIDIGSKLECKYTVSMSDPKITRSFNIYGFKFDHDEKTLVIWTFKAFNVTPIDVLKLIREQEQTVQPSKVLIDAILSKAK